MNRREFIGSAAATAASFAVRGLCGGEPNKPYTKANTDWLAKCRYGIGVHWTAWTVPRTGEPCLSRSGGCFDLKRFIGAVAHAGADYVLFTAAHALQMLPAPHPVIDRILPGRTCKRDLIWRNWPMPWPPSGSPCWSTTTTPATQRTIHLGSRRSATMLPTRNRLPKTCWKSLDGWASGTRTKSRRGGSTARIRWILVARTTA